ncbi:MAG: HEAT repeat domain-containing protein [Thermodesulfovibrio sp.]|uniref:HEAT repeat domain-containing protein n=1 Tax=Thermodesulfovibrio obliviosus TaxID=3118332 RepID=A0AAU8H579_9BACT
MKIFLKFLILIFLLFPFTSVYSLTIDELLKELDTPQWREKVSNPAFVEKFKNPDMLSTVIKLADARGYDWRYRIRAIKLLGSIGSPQAEEALLGMFQDPFFHHECPSLKSYVADALGDFKPSIRLLEILKEGLNDPETLVREATAKSLGRIKMAEAVKYLKEAFLSEKTLAVRIAIVSALKSIGTPEAVNFIKEIASDGNHKELLNAFGGAL